ncbi:MAG: preprotein translocase subunit Sec61beta [Methermicoccaceae archaeon]
MAKKKKGEGSGLISSAGLMRYMEAEESRIKIEPKSVVIIGVIIGFGVLALNIQYGLWP